MTTIDPTVPAEVHTYAPCWLDRAGLGAEARALRLGDLPQIVPASASR